jgi:hypothetical protein
MARPQAVKANGPGERRGTAGGHIDPLDRRSAESRRGLDSVKEPPTADALRHEIDFGKTADKVPFPDPATAPLGTDDESAGRPPSRRERQLASLHERTIGRLLRASRSKPDHEGEAWVTPVFIAGIIVCGVVIVLGALISI